MVNLKINREPERRWVHRTTNLDRIALLQTIIKKLDRLMQNAPDERDQRTITEASAAMRTMRDAWEAMIP
jgi:hypothetical protein